MNHDNTVTLINYRILKKVSRNQCEMRTFLVILQSHTSISKFTTLYTNHCANHCTTTASPDTNQNRTIRSYSIRPIDTWEIEYINQLSAPNCCLEIFTFAPSTRYLSVLFTMATRDCKCVRKARKANRSFSFLASFLLWLLERSVEPEERSLAMIHHCRRLFFQRWDSHLRRPEWSTTKKAKTIIDINHHN